MSLHKRLTQNLRGKTGGLVVHLHRRDAPGCTGYLEVHITEEVFKTLNVRQDNRLAILLNKTHGNTGDRAYQRHTGIHKGKRRSTGRSH